MILRRGICYECFLVQVCKSPLEEHHVFGRPGPTVIVPGNFHRALNRQLEARMPILRPKIDDPLVAAAQLLTIIAEHAEAGADYSRCLGLPDWVAELAKIIAAACPNMADKQLVIHAHLIDQHSADWLKHVVLP
jgi:hypothetical protein